MSFRWYVVKAMSGREDRALKTLKDQLRISGQAEKCNDFLIPVEHITEVKRGKKVTTKRKLYPGYIYAELQIDNPLIELIRSIDGIMGFLGSDPQHPDPLTAEEAERIIKIANAAGSGEQVAAMIQIPYTLGDTVKVKEGTFAGMDGVVDEINPQKGVIKVLITVFGRQTPIDLEVWQVEETT